jgi:hypothetical protein
MAWACNSKQNLVEKLGKGNTETDFKDVGFDDVD